MRTRTGDQALGQLVLPAGLELFRRGELLDDAGQLRNEVLGAHAPLGDLHAEASYGRDVAEADVGGLTALTDSFLTAGPNPGLQGELNDGAHVHGSGEILVAADGNMPPPAELVGPPPIFVDEGILFDPNGLSPYPPSAPRGGNPWRDPGVEPGNGKNGEKGPGT
jgi:hypothetical protein